MSSGNFCLLGFATSTYNVWSLVTGHRQDQRESIQSDDPHRFAYSTSPVEWQASHYDNIVQCCSPFFQK